MGAKVDHPSTWPDASGQPVTGVVDGDTFALANGQHARLWGADAPETKQQGLGFDGQPVPIGRVSTDNAKRNLDGIPANLTRQVSASYGRPVGPIDAGGADLGHDLIRSGSALAVPGYLSADPARQFDYAQAERLARQNGLGIHNTVFQSPSDFRHNPLPIEALRPEREEYARWWDTPTRDSGMKPDVERRFIGLMNDASVPIGDVVKFAADNGFTTDAGLLARNRAAAKRSGKPISMAYDEARKVMTDAGDGAAGAAVRGIGNGALPNLLEEVGALADTFGGTPGRENVFNSDRRLADVWANNAAQNESITGFDAYAHPWATTGGQIAGGLLPVGLGKINSAADLAKFGAGYGFLSGAGLPGSIPERLTSGTIGAGEGAAVTVLGGKALEAVTPYAGKTWRWATGQGAKDAPEAVTGTLDKVAEKQAAWPATLSTMRQGGAEVVPGALYHPQLGEIDLRLGKTGDPARDFKDGFGFAHIEAKHGHEGIIDDLPERIAGMDIVEHSPGKDRVQLEGPGGRAAIATTWHGDEQQWVLTAFDPNWKPPRNETSTPSLLQGAPDSAHHGGGTDIGANGPIDNVPPPPPGSTIDAMPMAAEPGASISAEVRKPDHLATDRPQPLDQPLSEAQLRAASEGVAPGDVLPIPSNAVGSVEEAVAKDRGRIVPATVPHESTELSRSTVTGWNGAPVKKVGPTDLVGWLRLNGGLQNQVGELTGLSNAARRGMDHVGQETRFGPLVNPDGMKLDDAAEKAWDAGWFPNSLDRPDLNTFLDAVRGTHDGWGRVFHPDDWTELARFNGARGERLALESARGHNDGEPIYTDKSEPAGAEVPFAPPEAYQEWPAGGPDFAGNLNLGKLDSPQDIKRALDTTQRRVGGFDAATRGRVTQAETERLAADLGMTPDTLIARRKGQAFNAEEALAARQILAKSSNELVNAAKALRNLGENPGDEALAEFRRKWVRHVAIQEQVAGATAEAGRALSQFRMDASSRAIRGDVLNAMVNGGGGADRIRNAADMLLDAVETGPGQFNALAEKMVQPRFRDKWRELYYNMLLSRPTTHIVNVVSNTMTALGQIPEHIIAAGVGGIRAAAGRGSDRIVGAEISARTFGFIQGFKEGMAEFANTARTGQVRDHASKIEGQDQFAIGGALGKIIRTPTRLLSAEDELFKAVARRMELNGLAVRQARKEGLKGTAVNDRIAELVANPPDDMLARTMDYGRYLTFQRPLDGIASGIQQAKEKSTIGTLLVPFVRTPTNILKFALERSPAAPLIKEWRKDFRAGGARRDLAIARVMVGSAMGAAVYQAALEGRITGSPPTDAAKAQFERADGWQPYSLRIGNKFYSISRLDPFATTIGVAADMATKRDGMTSRQADDYALLVTTSIIKNMGDKTWLSGASDFIRAITDPERYGKSYIRKMAAGLVTPALSAGVSQSVDPTVRDVRSVPDAIKSRIPGLSSSLPAKRDIWGEPIDREGGAASNFLSPIWQSTAKNDPVNREMLAIGARFDDPDRFIGKGENRVDLTPTQYERLAETAGRGTRSAIESLMADPAWKSMPREAKVKAVREAASAAKKAARETVMGGQTGGAAQTGLPGTPPPPGATIDGEAGGVNVLADLQRAIPGVQPTSGYRTPAYQAEMRRRGYTPADNSGHLDGSALDLLPPPGKSLRWLAIKVKRIHPEAVLLNEGDHLHARFPGWWGAPPLGGAKAAGLHNPWAGMPAPPPGATLDRN